MLKNASLPQMLCAEDRRWFCCGSLPFADVKDAISFIENHPSIVPFWPEIRTETQGGMLPRAMRACEPSWRGYEREEAPGLFSHLEVLGRKELKPRLYKGQLCGPVTLSAYGLCANPLDFETQLERALGATIRQIEWQAETVGRALDARLLMVLDEPALVNWTKFSHPQQRRIVESYSVLYVRMAERGLFSGLHSCAPLELELLELPLELYSFDALRNALQPEMRSVLVKALQRGLVLAPGTFPAATHEGSRKALDDGLRLFKEFFALSAERANQRQILLAANCGHSGASAAWVNHLYGLSGEPFTLQTAGV